MHYAVKAFEVGARGDFGDDAAIAFVLSLRVYDVGEGATTRGVEDGGTGVVAGRFYGQYHVGFISHRGVRGILSKVRIFSLLFTFIALVILAQFLIYVSRGPVNPVIASVIFFGFLACLAPALYLLKPFERPEKRREREEKERHGKPPEDSSE